MMQSYGPTTAYAIADSLIELAKDWPTRPDVDPVTGPVTLCQECRSAIWEGQSAGGRLAHLTLAHGYRMDGKRYGDDNKEY